jgi:hypothetical protein
MRKYDQKNYYRATFAPFAPIIGLSIILTAVCNTFKITEMQISGKRRYKELVAARQIYCYMAKHNTNYSLSRIGSKINRDHTTVLHSIAECFNRCDEFYNPQHIIFNKNFYQLFKEAINQLNYEKGKTYNCSNNTVLATC